MRVLHIITDSNIGGAGRHILTLLDAMDRDAFTLEVALPAGSLLIPLIAERGVRFHEVAHIGEKSFSWKGVRALRNVLRREKPDLVHTHAALAGRLAAKLCGVPVVHTRHSVFPPDARTMRFPLRPILGFMNHRLSDAIIAVSPAAAENLTQTGTKGGRITVIYNGVPPARVFSLEEKAAVRERYGIPPDAFVVSLIARLTAVKGQDYALDAAKVWAADPSIVLLIAGNGPDEERLRERVRQEGLHNVLMTGFVSAVEALENITDLQINASYGTEATSLSLLEGMSLGIPAVVSDFGGNPFVITHGLNGLLVPRQNAAALAEAVLQVKNDSDLYARLRQGAAAEYAERFRAEVMARQIEALYNRVGANCVRPCPSLN